MILTKSLEARVLPSRVRHCRVGVVVAKYGHTIVERNRLRRQIRELARIRLIPSFTGIDLIIRALSSAYSSKFDELTRDVDQIKLGLTRNASEE